MKHCPLPLREDLIAQPSAHDTQDIAGATLPASFPRDGISDDKLVEIDEWFHAYLHAGLDNLRALLELHPRTLISSYNVYHVNCVTLGKMLNISPLAHLEWHELADMLLISRSTLWYHRRAIALHLGKANLF